MLLHRNSPDLAMNVPLQNGQSISQETNGEIGCRKTWLCDIAHRLGRDLMPTDASWSRDVPSMVTCNFRTLMLMLKRLIMRESIE